MPGPLPKPPPLTIQNRQRRADPDLPALKKNAGTIMTAVWNIHAEQTPLRGLNAVDVFLISDRRMAALHRQFLGESGPTDVLTFEHGEIFIGVETALRNARRYRTPLVREISLYIIHGLLHLHGFDDREARGLRRMERVQERIVNSLL